VGWSYLAQDRDQCWALMNISGPFYPIKEGKFASAEQLSASEKGIFFMQLAQFENRQQSNSESKLLLFMKTLVCFVRHIESFILWTLP
jgi:hypothetical protein